MRPDVLSIVVLILLSGLGCSVEPSGGVDDDDAANDDDAADDDDAGGGR